MTRTLLVLRPPLHTPDRLALPSSFTPALLGYQGGDFLWMDPDLIGVSGGLGWFSITDYGAVDGGTAAVNTPAIQSAITACAAAGGGIVYVPAGTYKISAQASGQRYGITVPSNVILMGDGMFVSVLEFDPAQTLPAGSVFIPIEIGTATTGASNVTIRDLGLDANWTALNAGGTEFIEGIAARHSTTVTAHSDDITIERVRVLDANAGIYCAKNGSTNPGSTADRFERWSVRDCVVETTNNKAIELQMAQDSEIVGNRTIDATDGIQLLHSCTRVAIAHNIVEYRNSGINVREAITDFDVDGNIVTCIGGGSASLADLPAGIVIGTENVLASPALGRGLIRNNVITDLVSTLRVAIMFNSYVTNVAATFTDVVIENNVFNSDLAYIADPNNPTKSSATRLKVRGNYFGGTCVTNANWVSDRTRFERNHVISNFTSNSNNWDFRENVFGGTFTHVGTGYTLDDGYVRNVLVSSSAPSANQTIVTSSSTAAAWADYTLDGLTDVTISSASNSEVLRYNGSAWVDATLVLDDLGDVTVTSAPSNLSNLYYDQAGSTWRDSARIWRPIMASSSNLLIDGATNEVVMGYA